MVRATEGASSKAGQNASDELRKTTKVAVLEKGFISADPDSRRFQTLLTFKCSYENTSTWDVRAFTGAVVFQDLFGKKILRIGILFQIQLRPGRWRCGTGQYTTTSSWTPTSVFAKMNSRI
jgi:hypothetical protein